MVPSSSVKLSILLLYLSIFTVNRKMKYIIYFGIAIQVVFYLAYFAVCLAIELLSISILSLSTTFCNFCYDNWKFVLVHGAIYVATDFYVLCLPLAKSCSCNLRDAESSKSSLSL